MIRSIDEDWRDEPINDGYADGIIPIGDNEKTYIIEKGNHIVLVRGSHSKNYPLTGDVAKQMAIDAKEIDKKDAKNWRAYELDDVGFANACRRMKERQKSFSKSKINAALS